MAVSDYVYVTDIATTPEKLWAALTGPEFWRQFSGPVETDWKSGSPIKYFLPDGKLYAVGVILESNPPYLLIQTWPNPEVEQGNDPIQRLTWKVEHSGSGTVKLTMLHENLNEKDYQGVSQGWPSILGNLKCSLEAALTPET